MDSAARLPISGRASAWPRICTAAGLMKRMVPSLSTRRRRRPPPRGCPPGDGAGVDRLAVSTERAGGQAREEEVAGLALEQALHRAGGQRLHDHFVGIGAGDDGRQDVPGLRMMLQCGDQRGAILARHEVVDDRDVERLRQRQPEAIGRAVGRFHDVAVVSHQLHEGGAHRRRIVHQQHALRALRPRRGCRQHVLVTGMFDLAGDVGVVAPAQERGARARHAPLRDRLAALVGEHHHRTCCRFSACSSSRRSCSSGVSRPARHDRPCSGRGRAWRSSSQQARVEPGAHVPALCVNSAASARRRVGEDSASMDFIPTPPAAGGSEHC